MSGPTPPSRPRAGRPTRKQAASTALSNGQAQPPTGAATDSAASVRSTKHAAWVAAGAAILAAVIAFSGALWSAKVAAKAASDTVTRQVSGETEKSKAEFLRGQRQVLYSNIIAHERALRAAEEAAWEEFQRSDRRHIGRPTARDLENMLNRLKKT